MPRHAKPKQTLFKQTLKANQQYSHIAPKQSFAGQAIQPLIADKLRSAL